MRRREKGVGPRKGRFEGEKEPEAEGPEVKWIIKKERGKRKRTEDEGKRGEKRNRKGEREEEKRKRGTNE